MMLSDPKASPQLRNPPLYLNPTLMVEQAACTANQGVVATPLDESATANSGFEAAQVAPGKIAVRVALEPPRFLPGLG